MKRCVTSHLNVFMNVFSYPVSGDSYRKQKAPKFQFWGEILLASLFVSKKFQKCVCILLTFHSPALVAASIFKTILFIFYLYSSFSHRYRNIFLSISAVDHNCIHQEKVHCRYGFQIYAFFSEYFFTPPLLFEAKYYQLLVSHVATAVVVILKVRPANCIFRDISDTVGRFFLILS